jgi:hypothetical protein
MYFLENRPDVLDVVKHEAADDEVEAVRRERDFFGGTADICNALLNLFYAPFASCVPIHLRP